MWIFLTYVIVGFIIAIYAIFENKGQAFYVGDIPRVIFIWIFWPVVVAVSINWDNLLSAKFKAFLEKRLW